MLFFGFMLIVLKSASLHLTKKVIQIWTVWEEISLIFLQIILRKPLITSLVSLQDLLESLTGILRT